MAPLRVFEGQITDCYINVEKLDTLQVGIHSYQMVETKYFTVGQFLPMTLTG
jgi:hypothetical protein